MKIEVNQIDWLNPKEAAEALALLNHYALGITGGGEAIDENVLNSLPEKLSNFPGGFTLLLYVEGKAVGLANCFESFSTFKAKPLVNIHDFMIHEDYRGHGYSKVLLEGVKQEALTRGCCKITLEVLEGNTTAINLYKKVGFKGYELDPNMGKAVFFEMPLV